jgi:hypothetical protein
MSMKIQANVAHYLNGRTRGPGLEAVEGLGLRPALMAHYRDLSELRYDYPLLLVDSTDRDPWAISLSALFDSLTAPEDGGEVGSRRHTALRLEREIRRAALADGGGRLATLLAEAVARLSDGADETVRGDLEALQSAVQLDGPLVDCDGDLPGRLVRQSWQRVEARKAHLTWRAIERLTQKLSDILRADEANSAAGQEEDRLESSFGDSFTSDFDFGAMSKLLTTARPASTLPDARRERIRRLLHVLQAQRFFATPEAHDGTGGQDMEPYSFVFTSSDEAVQAYRARLPELSELAKAMMMADLEVDGAYRAEVHDRLFEQGIDDPATDASGLTRFPSYLVVLPAGRLPASESGPLLQALAAGLPIKVLLQTDDISGPPQWGNGDEPDGPDGLDVRHVTGAAMSLSSVYVLQTTSSHMYRARDQVRRAMGFSGPALLGVFSGAGGVMGDLPPYLVAAAAMESRVFPTFVYDPTAGPDWASRCDVGGNPQAELDWPVHEIAYEDDSLQRHAQPVAFTAADFLACDTRNADYLARVPADKWNGGLAPVADVVAEEAHGMPEQVPYLLMVDPSGGVHRVLAGRHLAESARECRARWHVVRELGGVRNSFAERQVAEARAQWEAERALEVEALPPQTVTPTVVAEEAADGEAAEAVAAPSPDEPRIDTTRCSSCNECILINDRMFQYDGNKQAFIADLSAGTYAEMVLAAERCQVAVIHPGKPINPDEPGLEDLLKRAEQFL